MIINYTKLNENAMIFERKTSGAVAYDMFCCEELVIKSGDVALIGTGIAIELPEGYEAQVRGRSSVFYNTDVEIGLGTIDSDYRGEIRVMAKNRGELDYIVLKGDRLAQLIINKVELPTFIQVDQLSQTKRNTGGFGSTNESLKELVDEINRNE